VNFRSGQLLFGVSSTQLSLPNELRSPEGRILEVPCGPMGMCPMAAEVTIGCEAGVCDPAPRTLSVPVGDVVDFDAYSADLRELFREVDTIEVRQIDYAVTLNTLTVDLDRIELFWGPEGAIDVDPAMGVTPLGSVPVLQARTTPAGQVELDGAGNAAMGEYLVSTSRRVRFFARTQVDLRPGDPFPEGELTVAVVLAVTATGQVIN